jgi:4-hydroxybenzoate polyprenyltransferase
VLALVGLGRLYIGHYAVGFSQLVLAPLGGAALSEWLPPDLAFLLVPGVVGVIDAALILTGQVHDRQDRPLRD